MPNKWTFQIKPIKKLIDEEMNDGRWIDPFCGSNQRATMSNDLNPEVKADYHMDTLEFLKLFPDCSFDGAHFDPPFSPRQFKECYDYMKLKAPSQVFNAGYLAKCRDQIARLLKTNSKVISCGWNSNGIGANRGFKIERILLVAHGSGHNDTIITVDRKIQATLSEL